MLLVKEIIMICFKLRLISFLFIIRTISKYAFFYTIHTISKLVDDNMISMHEKGLINKDINLFKFEYKTFTLHFTKNASYPSIVFLNWKSSLSDNSLCIDYNSTWGYFLDILLQIKYGYFWIGPVGKRF